MLKTAYQIGVEKAFEEAGFDFEKDAQWWRSMFHPVKAWRTAKEIRLRATKPMPLGPPPSRAGLGKGLRAMTESPARGGRGEGVRALTETAPAATPPSVVAPPSAPPSAVAPPSAPPSVGGPAAAKPIPSWAKMLGLGGVGGGAYYAGTRTAPEAVSGGFFGLEPDQGLQQLSPELIRLLLTQQGLPY